MPSELRWQIHADSKEARRREAVAQRQGHITQAPEQLTQALRRVQVQAIAQTYMPTGVFRVCEQHGYAARLCAQGQADALVHEQYRDPVTDRINDRAVLSKEPPI